MAAKKKTFDKDAVAKAAIPVIVDLVSSGEKASTEAVVKVLVQTDLGIAPTRLGVLLKELSETNKLDGFYLQRGRGFVHENDVPRTAAPKKVQAKKTRKRKSVTPAALAAEIDKQAREAALEEYKAERLAFHRKALGLKAG